MELSKEEVQQIRDALMANGIFHTPIMNLRLKGVQDEFRLDAHKRTLEVLDMLDKK